ncbi:MAG TPA: hypothetical protein V6C86_19230 [Oculatellaceae cyanobacterium]
MTAISAKDGKTAQPVESNSARFSLSRDAEAVAHLAKEALVSAAYEGLQQPVTAVAQLVDQVVPRAELESKVQFVSAQEPAAFGTADWHAQQLGGAAGQILPFLLARAGAKPIVGKLFGESEEAVLALKRAPIGMSMTEAGVAGFINGALLTPTNDRQNFVASRLVNGANGVATMTTLTASSVGLAKVAETAPLQKLGVSKLLLHPVVSGLISGVPAGLVGSELSSGESERRLATSSEIGHSIYSMSMVGGTFGAIGGFAAKAGVEGKSIGPEPRSNHAVENLQPEQNQDAKTPKTEQTHRSTDSQTISVVAPTSESNRIQAPADKRAPIGIQLELPLGSEFESKALYAVPELNSVSISNIVKDAVEPPRRTGTGVPEQLSLQFPDRLSAQGEKAYQLLKDLQKLTPEETEKPGEPVTMREAQALRILLDEWVEGAQLLYSRLYYRSRVAAHMAWEIWTESSMSKLEDDMPGIYERALIAGDPANKPTPEDHVGVSYGEKRIGIENQEDAAKFMAIWKRSRPLNNWIGWQGNSDAATLMRMARWSRIDEIPDEAIKPISSRYQCTEEQFGPDTDPQTLVKAAQGWRFVPEVNTELAIKIGEMEPQSQFSASQAFNKTIEHFGVEREDAAKLFLGEKAAEAEAFMLKQIEELSGQRTRLLIKHASPVSLPVAVHSLLSDILEPPHRVALIQGLNMFKRPTEILATMDPSTFREAYDALVRDNPHDKVDWSKRHFFWHERSAVVLATVFKSNWKNWLDSQSRAGRDNYDATTWLTARPPAAIKGLGSFLLENNARAVNHLERIADAWMDIKDSPSRAFNDVLNQALLNRYEKIEDPAFAREASLWNVKADDYPQFEKRYMASKSVPMPFPTDQAWSAEGLTGRFIPRDDPRGLFVGEHTNCCQHPGGNADSSAWYGQENPKSGFFIIENANKDIVAQSWTVVTDDGGLIFDNVEAKGLGNQQGAALSIYKQTAESLAGKFHTITMGVSNSDLNVESLPLAGNKTQLLPRDFSGYTDAGMQVLLASAEEAAPKPGPPPIVRGALSLDKPIMTNIAEERFPDGWTHLPWEPETRGLVVQDADGKVQGYALYEPSNHYISDMAVRVTAGANYGYLLTTGLFKIIRSLGGEWSADMRESTSYRMVTKAGEKGRIKIVSDKTTDAPMGNEPMHHVVFKIPDTSDVPGGDAGNREKTSEPRH